MSGTGIKRGAGVYTYMKDRDKSGEFFWIVGPSGEQLGFVDAMWMVRKLLEHLNRSDTLAEPIESVTPQPGEQNLGMGWRE